jgi:hypothetical protein
LKGSDEEAFAFPVRRGDFWQLAGSVQRKSATGKLAYRHPRGNGGHRADDGAVENAGILVADGTVFSYGDGHSHSEPHARPHPVAGP